MNDRNNTIAGWVLFAGIVALGSSIVSSEVFNTTAPRRWAIRSRVWRSKARRRSRQADRILSGLGRPDQGRAGVQEVHRLPQCRQGRRQCAWPEPVGRAGRAGRQGAMASPFPRRWRARAAIGTGTSLSDWLANPKKFAPGTKMTFAGLGNPEDRANVIAFLNAHSDAPKPLPAAPAAAAPAEVRGRPPTPRRARRPRPRPRSAAVPKRPPTCRSSTRSTPKRAGPRPAAATPPRSPNKASARW